MFFLLILENETGHQIDFSQTANRYMTSKIEGLNPPAGTISTSTYAGMNGSYLNNAFIEKRNLVIPMEIFQTGRIVGRDDDKEHFGIIESVKIETDTENGDYLTVSGRFLMCLIERRIIYPTLNFTSLTSYSDIVRTALQENVINTGNRAVPSLSLGSVYGACWEQTIKLQVSYQNLMEWIYTICETIGGIANIRL